MNILLKRNYKLIIIFVLIFLVSIAFNNTRIISYNFGKYETEIEMNNINYTNSHNILDDSLVHEIELSISDEQYEYLISYYRNNKVKEYIQTDITIDGKTIPDVGVRLKGNIDLLEILSEEDNFIKPALLIKFDKYTKGQTYQHLSQIALRVDSEETLLGQLTSYKLFQEIGLLAPDSSYSTVKFGEKGNYLYLVSEVIDEAYISEHFPESEGVLYKALNGISFSYLGEDPTLYTDLFDQKTSINYDDLSKMIQLLKFVSQSTDEDFGENLENYIDIESYVGMIVMDEILGNHDKLLGLLNNYYIYIDTETGIASFITWDQKLSFGNIGDSLEEILLKYYSAKDLDNIEDIDIDSLLTFTRNGIKQENLHTESSNIYRNDLKERFLKSEYFRTIYQETLEKYQSEIYTNNLASDILQYYKTVFISLGNYSDYIELFTYENTITRIENFLEHMKNMKKGGRQ